MAMPVEVLEAELLRLPTAERTRLLDHVIASLDADNARDRAWDQIAAERQAEIESGSVTAIDGHVFLAQLRADLA